MNDLSFNWKKIRKGLPGPRQAANYREPTVEGIQKLTDCPDRRIKPIVYTKVSSGIRLGSWDYLRWKHVIPLKDDNSQIDPKDMQFIEQLDKHPNQYPNDRNVRIRILGLGIWR